MDNIRIGVICPSEIAFRRFLPSLQLAEGFEYVGVAIASKEEFVGATDEILAKEINITAAVPKTNIIQIDLLDSYPPKNLLQIAPPYS